MRFILRPVRLFFAAVCVCQGFALSSFGQIQASPSAAFQQMNGQLMPGDMIPYHHFIEFVGQEDDRIRKQAQDGKTQTAARTDYAKNMYISTDEEQAMLAIVLDAYRQEREVDGRPECRKSAGYFNSVSGGEVVAPMPTTAAC